jgi:hypothetical protein
MSDKLRELADIDGRLSDAVRQLREQHSLIAAINFKRANYDAFLALLSNALRQFSCLEKQRKRLLQKFAAEFFV